MDNNNSNKAADSTTNSQQSASRKSVTVPFVNHKISNVVISEMPANSMFVKPKRMAFTQNSVNRKWDLVECHDAVACLCYHKTKKAFLFVKQFRPAVYYAKTKRTYTDTNTTNDANTNANTNTNATENDNEAKTETTTDVDVSADVVLKGNIAGHQLGCTYECVAGIIDKKHLSLPEIMQEELLEEAGYNVPLAGISKVSEYLSGVGILGYRVVMFYAEIDESMKVIGKGGGAEDENECIELIWVPVSESMEFVMNPMYDIPPGLKFIVFWFYLTYPELCKEVTKSTL